MKFCSQCARPLVLRWLDEDTRTRLVCPECGYVVYENPKLLVWCFAYWDNRIVLCRRSREPARGLWNPPSGFIEAGETLEEAISREMIEEAGLAVEPSRFALYRVSSIPHMNQVYIGYRVELHAEPRLVCGAEATEVGLYGEHDAPLRQMAFREMLSDVPQAFFAYLRSGVFPIVSETVQAPFAR